MQQQVLNMLTLTEKQEELIRYIQTLDKSKRHTLTIVCRGTEPWEIKEHITETKIPLIPKYSKH
jgi:hypothetical protein